MSETPELLFENYDIGLGGPSTYEAWFDVGGDVPVCCTVYQAKVAENGNKRAYRWRAVAALLSPAFLAGQAERFARLTDLAKSDMSVRALESDAEANDYLHACREDGALLAERSALLLGAVRQNGKKR